MSAFHVIVVQQDRPGILYDFYYYNDVECGKIIVEITGGNELAPHHFFTWSGAYQTAAPTTGNLIHADKVQIYTSVSPPPIQSLPGSSNLFQTVAGALGFSPHAIGQSTQSALQSGLLTVINQYGYATSDETSVWNVDTAGNSYPVDNSSTINVRQDPISKTIYFDLLPTYLDNLNSLIYTDTTEIGGLLTTQLKCNNFLIIGNKDSNNIFQEYATFSNGLTSLNGKVACYNDTDVYGNFTVHTNTRSPVNVFSISSYTSPKITSHAPVVGNGYIYNKSDVDSILSGYYTKANIDTTLSSQFYNQGQISSLFLSKIVY
jgi:hypothetical protein